MTAVLRRAGLAGLAALAVLATPARAADEAYPSRPVRVVVPYAAGGVVDTSARLVQQGLQQALGQPVVIDNRSGANGVIGATLVAKAPADGYTLLLDLEAHAVTPAINAKLPYDTARDFAPVGLLATVSRLFVINDRLAVRTLGEFVALAKAQPGQLNYASPATPVRLAMELFKSMAGIELAYVAYRGGAPAMQAMLAGETQITLVPLTPVLGPIQSGQLRALAVASARRTARLPDVPTVAEAGYAAFEAPSWIGLLAPAGTPRPIIDRLYADLAAVLRTPDVARHFDELGMDVAALPPDDFGRLIARDIATWTAVARAHNIVEE
ncbi:MAG: tripartite tricarboxylate transporter substrate binding protein [Proteobacteria bacterium]|nr:tripartite tricarboxylate transporter substrate binding protein [Pseudomonadota bacterium]